ncbi:MAG: hypothetical protein SVY53_14480 [Chloroflexota bacterium]|nr:hypothetical protein [Chloroflexota bacterium]
MQADIIQETKIIVGDQVLAVKGWKLRQTILLGVLTNCVGDGYGYGYGYGYDLIFFRILCLLWTWIHTLMRWTDSWNQTKHFIHAVLEGEHSDQ